MDSDRMGLDKATTWHSHPDPAMEALLVSGTGAQLSQALVHPRIANDPYARLRCLDRLRYLFPDDHWLEIQWMQAMLIGNRPGIAWAAIVNRSPRPDEGLRGDDLMLAAQVAQAVGETETARRCYRALVQQYPNSVDVWQKYVEFESPDGLPDNLPVLIQSLVDRANNDYQREKGFFSLAHYWHKSDPKRAFGFAENAHLLKRKRVGAWRQDELIRRLDMDGRRVPCTVSAEKSQPRPVFIVGLPRSGTTLLSSLLGAHSSIANAGEQNLLPALGNGPCREPVYGNHPIRQFARHWYLAAIADMAKDSVAVIDKLPANIERSGLILELFPDSLLIFIERDFMDCGLSIYLHDFEYGQLYANCPEDIRDYAIAVRDHAVAIGEKAPGRFFHVRYERLTQDPKAELQSILDALGLDWQDQMLDFWKRGAQVATYSEGQVREPLNRSSVGRWSRYLPVASDFFRTLSPDFNQ